VFKQEATGVNFKVFDIIKPAGNQIPDCAGRRQFIPLTLHEKIHFFSNLNYINLISNTN